jgi:hypothetical protein
VLAGPNGRKIDIPPRGRMVSRMVVMVLFSEEEFVVFMVPSLGVMDLWRAVGTLPVCSQRSIER